MDHIRIIKQAWKITWNYRILWIFGFLLALSTGSGGGGGSGSGYRMDESDIRNWFPHGEFNVPGFSQAFQDIFGAVLTLIIVFACLGVLLTIVFAIARYVSETALFRMVNQYEADETKYSFKEGFRLGWSRNAFYLFLMDLIVGLAGFIAFTLLLLIAAIPLLSWLVENDVVRTIGTVASAGLGLLVLFLAILAAIVIGLVMQFARRVCVLENRGVIESLQEGFNMVRARLSDSIIMGLILFGIGLAFGILMIPVMIILVIIAAILGGIPGLLAYWIASMALEGAAPYILAFIVAFPLFLLVVIIPSAIIGGVFETFKSSVWTLTFREFRSLFQSPDLGDTPPHTHSTLVVPTSEEDEPEMSEPEDEPDPEIEDADLDETDLKEDTEPEENSSSG